MNRKKKIPDSVDYEKTPLVSVVIPAYNSASSIERTVHSILDQTYTSFEIIAVFDEGSSDETLAILQSLGEKSRVSMKIIETPHMGRSAARNIGWRASSGSILFFADSDEIYKAEYLEMAVEEIVSKGVVGVTITGSSWSSKRTLIGRLYSEVYTRIQREKEKAGQASLTWAWVYDRNAIELVGGFDESLDQAEDRDLFIRIRDNGGKIGVIYGEHWFHQRPSDITTFIRKTWIGAINRIQFVVKHRKIREIVTNLAPMFAIATLLLSFAISFLLASLITFFLLGLITIYMISRYYRWYFVPNHKLLLLYILLSLVTRVITSAGYLYGLLNLIVRPGTGVSGVYKTVYKTSLYKTSSSL